ncbi:uncharacterized protein SPSK_09755 [Sporothrix schenckii 1099-18]|uniref:DUF962 domain-containing protein n=2 Tax=Sporothrix schenckii TaxID=29908 RepID=U7Q590_SPOS1|nr:uncharacterized protein SPSK_09755 [Sporothrix schenckii 1099-18]ERT03049.1 hypothetical protein HMPREF1624_01354 [Sporothrix schenckii ATCC 58251]KJR84555.1 hypothetical protein SPSK_09755 [Sporothrix schenckii 1099-18]
MSLDLEKHLVFYGAYHHNKINVVVHMICVPLILFTGFWMASNSPTLIPLPSWLTVPNLPLNLGTLAAITWGALYVLLEPVAGTALALLCLGGAAAGNYALSHFDAHIITTYAAATHIASWILQFVGHAKFERQAPALLDNLFQAIFLAPLFVWLELLFAFGYRQELQGRVEREVQKEIAKFQASKTVAKDHKNGKAQ